MDCRARVRQLSICIVLILLRHKTEAMGHPFSCHSVSPNSSPASYGWQVPLVVWSHNQSLVGRSLFDFVPKLTKTFTGAISDSSHSKYRRRYWVVLSTAVLCISTLVLAYCQIIAAFFVDLFGGGAGDWDPKQIEQVSIMSTFLMLPISQHCRAGVQHSNWTRSSLLLSSGLCYQCSPGISSEPSP